MKQALWVTPLLHHSITLPLLLLIVGCNIVGAVTYKVAGPTPIAPKYAPPKEPMVVLVERYNAPSSSVTESETLAKEIFRDLSAHDVAQQIDPITVMNLRDEDPQKFKTMTVSQIGSRVTARQVLYVNLTAAGIESSDGGGMFRGVMAARVKVIDVATGATVWPTDAADGYPISGEIKPTLANQSATPDAARLALIRKMAVSTARLFYKWQPEDEMPD